MRPHRCCVPNHVNGHVGGAGDVGVQLHQFTAANETTPPRIFITDFINKFRTLGIFGPGQISDTAGEFLDAGGFGPNNFGGN